jgi:hypothetical protein
MATIKVQIDDNPARIIGAENATTVSVKVVDGCDWQTPAVYASAYLRDGDTLIEHRGWEFPLVSPRAVISITLGQTDKPDPPDVTDIMHEPLLPDDRKTLEVKAAELEQQAINLQKQLSGSPCAKGDPAMAELHVYCSFCGKSKNEVRKIIAGPAVYICDECIDVCVDVLAR